MSQYRDLVDGFREVTSIVHPESGRCCKVAVGGVPTCCQKIIDGEELTFTEAEVDLLASAVRPFEQRKDGMFVLDREFWTPDLLASSLNDGWLAHTLECASHPTRPMVVGDLVTGVVVIDDCNGLIGLRQYHAHSERLYALWQEAVDLVGLKPYYVSHSLRPGWTVI